MQTLVLIQAIMMTSSNGNIFRVTGHLCGEFTGPGEFPAQSQWRAALMFSLICVWINGWVNNRKAGDLRRYRSHYDAIVMINGGIINPVMLGHGWVTIPIKALIPTLV